MFKGTCYRLHGFKDMWVAVDAREAHGVVTSMYARLLTNEEKAAMARRVCAALNMTRNLTLAELERAAPLPANES